jgi:hypothetical protein
VGVPWDHFWRKFNGVFFDFSIPQASSVGTSDLLCQHILYPNTLIFHHKIINCNITESWVQYGSVSNRKNEPVFTIADCDKVKLVLSGMVSVKVQR